ncbi:carbohydrate sulfotransferase 8-like isoform X2 [Eucyclogobius newberryi]|uniref:carbohydrate sulfotransferase 8-like isoform X2 n=1 Tax=Eucyclogobius newberryi TaxID=166745 RepID=UPI003B5CC310
MAMLWMKWRMVLGSLFTWRRRWLPSLWFLLLLTVGTLIVFFHQQDLSDTVQQQGPGTKMRSTPRQSREDGEKSDLITDHLTDEQNASSPIPPMQFPNFERTKQPTKYESTKQVNELLTVTPKSRKTFKTRPQLHRSNIVPPFPSSTSSSPSSSSGAVGTRLKLSGTLEARRELMRNTCAKYKSHTSRTITREHVRMIYVEDRYKLLYCEVPKAGCSNWKRTLMVLAGLASDTRSISHDTVHYKSHLKKLDSFDYSGIMRRLQTYTKVVFAREPMERLVSAFRDKFENPNKHYHTVYGRPIISKYRTRPSAEALNTGDGVTFTEFVQYLLDVHRPVGMDIHWNLVDNLCHPCLIDYDFIGKFENMQEESNILLRIMKAPRNLTLPQFKDRNPKDQKTSSEITEKYFGQVTPWQRQRVYDFFYMDYQMFNYSKPFKDIH